MDTPTTRSPQELLKFVVAAGGNLPLAAERAGVSKSDLVTMICGGDASNLTEGLRSLLVLSLFENIVQTGIAYRASLPYMHPDALAKAYAAQLGAFTQLTALPTPELNAEVQDATAAKRKLITRLDQWKKDGVTATPVKSKVEDVS